MYAGVCTYTLSLTHLMKVGPSSNNDYLSIARVAQVRCQLPLSWSVPAHIEEYLDDDEYDNNSVKERGRGEKMRGWDRHGKLYVSDLNFYFKSYILTYTSTAPFLWDVNHWVEALIAGELADPWPKPQPDLKAATILSHFSLRGYIHYLYLITYNNIGP